MSMITHIPANEWIASRKQKPEDGQEVLGIIGWADDERYIEIVQYSTRDQAWTTCSCSNGDDGMYVKWWTPLPALPYRDHSRKSLTAESQGG